MTQQTSLWQVQHQSADFAELCLALYERELTLLANISSSSLQTVQGRIKSLPYYVKRTAHFMTQVKNPLLLDTQNATWSAKQMGQMPLNDQAPDRVNQWYSSVPLALGLIVPIASKTHISLDSIDRIDNDKQRFRTNIHGWFDLSKDNQEASESSSVILLKPNKRVMTAACTGHCWLNGDKVHPIIPSIRELLLSCTINWHNFKRPISLKAS